MKRQSANAAAYVCDELSGPRRNDLEEMSQPVAVCPNGAGQQSSLIWGEASPKARSGMGKVEKRREQIVIALSFICKNLLKNQALKRSPRIASSTKQVVINGSRDRHRLHSPRESCQPFY
jgi:hypothetical protein